MTDAFTIQGLGESYRNGARTPGEVTDICLDRIAKADGLLHAFQSVFTDDARQAAEAADIALAAGRRPGPLFGVPFALKDIYDVAGKATGKGQRRTGLSPVTRGGTVVRRLVAAGGILLGKTRTVEIALGGWGVNALMGTPWNPWDRQVHRVPGGSSSGSAVAVAAGLAVCALGTDTGGSVRLPAAFCGVTGLKVTDGRLPTDGIMPLAPSLDTPGPITRTVTDAAILFQVMDGRDPEKTARDLQDRTGLFGVMNRGAAGLRLGALDAAERERCAPDVLAAYDSALDLLRSLGATIQTFAPGRTLTEISGDIGALIDAEAFRHHGQDYLAPDFPMNPEVRERVLAGQRIGPDEYRRMLRRRSAAQKDFLAAMQGLDALITPTTLVPALPVADIGAAPPVSHFTRPFNYLGMCALAVPMGLTAARLPASLQIAARAGDEAMALRIGAVYETARGPMDDPPLMSPH